MDEETLQKHSADFASFYEDIQPISLFNYMIDARVIFSIENYQDYQWIFWKKSIVVEKIFAPILQQQSEFYLA